MEVGAIFWSDILGYSEFTQFTQLQGGFGEYFLFGQGCSHVWVFRCDWGGGEGEEGSG